MKSHRIRAAFALCALLAVTATPLAATERQYDQEVEKTIDSAYRGLDRFIDSMDRSLKGGKITRNGVETDVSDFLTDLKSEGRLLKDRFGGAEMASANALDFLSKATFIGGFIARHPGMTGADEEWAKLEPILENLAAAYQIEWSTDPTTWKPVRTSDQAIATTLDGLDKQVQALGKEASKAGKAAKADKEAMKGLTASINSLRGAAKGFRDTFRKQQPVSGAANAFFDSFGKVEDRLNGLGLASATSSSMKPLSAAVSRLASIFGR